MKTGRFCCFDRPSLKLRELLILIPLGNLCRHLSDMNKDSALDIEEFCVAMHLVVAVKHEVELPAVLPAMLTPKSSTPPFAASFPVAAGGVSAHASTRLNGHPEEERPHSPEQKVLALDDQVLG